MNEPNAIREQLWDLVYGLLEPAEAEALHARIKSEPAVARLYADTVLEADLLAKAARIEAPPVELPAVREKVAPAKKVPAVARSGAASSGSSFARGLHWFAGMGATALALLIAVMLWRPQTATTPIATNAKVLEVFAAPQWQTGISNEVKVVARAPSGVPESVPLRLEVRDPQGHVNFSQNFRTSDGGVAELEIPGDAVRPGNRLQVQLADGESARGMQETTAASLAAELPAVEEAQQAAVTLDRDWYQPGETIRSRAVVLGRTTLDAAAKGAVRYEVTGPDGKELAGVSGTVAVTNGVAAAEVQLPADVPEGQYAFRVQGEGQGAEVDGADFVVRREAPRPALDALALTKQKREETRGGGIASGGMGGAAKVADSNATLRQRGSVRRSRSEDDFAKRTAQPPANAPLAKTESLADQPAAGLGMRGVQAESSLRQFAESNDFSAVPNDDSPHRLKMNLPAELTGKAVKVVVANARGEVLQTKESVVKALDDSVTVADPARRSGVAELDATSAAGVAAADGPAPADKARAAGGAPERAEADKRLAEVEVALAPEIQGSVQAYAVDVSGKRPSVVAQDQRFVPATRELSVRFHDYDIDCEPGQQVEFVVRVADEANRPASGAILGIRVVDEFALQSAPEAETLAGRWGLQLPTLAMAGAEEHRFYALGQEGLKRQLDRAVPLRLKDAEPALEAGAEKGSLMGRRPAVEASAGDAMYADVADELQQQQQVLASAQLGETVLATNRDAVEAAWHQSMAAHSSRRSVDYRFAGQVLVVGALLLALAAGLAYGLRLAPQTKVWGPAIGVCVASLVIGLLWIERSSPRPTAIATGAKSSAAPADAAARGRFDAFEHEEMAAPGEEAPDGDQTRLGKLWKDSDRQDDAELYYRHRNGRQVPLAGEDAEVPATPAEGGRGFAARENRAAATRDGAQAPAQRKFAMPEGAAREEDVSRSGPSQVQSVERQKEKLAEAADRLKPNAPAPPAATPASPLPKSASRSIGSVRMQAAPEADKPAERKPDGPKSEPGAAEPRPAPAASTPAPAPAPAPAAPSPATKPVEEKAGQEAKKMAPALERRTPPTSSPAAKPVDSSQDADSKATGSKAAAAKEQAKLHTFGLEPESAAGQKSSPLGFVQGRDETTANYVPLWAPQLVADDKGEVRVRFTLPERAANYRVFVDAHGNGRIGSATKELVAVAPPPAEDKTPPADKPDEAPSK